MSEIKLLNRIDHGQITKQRPFTLRIEKSFMGDCGVIKTIQKLNQFIHPHNNYKKHKTFSKTHLGQKKYIVRLYIKHI